MTHKWDHKIMNIKEYKEIRTKVDNITRELHKLEEDHNFGEGVITTKMYLENLKKLRIRLEKEVNKLEILNAKYN